jgi:hypothetical protein
VITQQEMSLLLEEMQELPEHLEMVVLQGLRLLAVPEVEQLQLLPVVQLMLVD